MNSSLEGNHSVLENTFVFLEPSTSKEEQLDDNESLKVDDILIQEPDLTADAKPQKEEFLENLNDNLDDEFKNLINKVTNEEEQQKLSFKSEVETIAPIEITKSECKYCAYFDEILTWKDPKISGAILTLITVSLISVASFSLLSIFGFVFLLGMTLVGSYRLYLTIMNKVKGQSDDTFNKFAAMKLTLPSEDLQVLVNLIETRGNDYIERLKQIFLWENIRKSSIAYLIAYCVYSIGCAVNTITLLAFFVIFAFSCPKIYRMYKIPIDLNLKKVHTQIVDLIEKIKRKVPFLNKKKVE